MNLLLPNRRLVVPTAPDRFDLLDAAGQLLPPDSADCAAFIDHLTWTMHARTLPERQTQAGAVKACAMLKLFGFEDWTPGARAVVAPLIADGRSFPATYPAIAADTKSGGYWTDTPVPGGEGYFFVVLFSGGHVYYGYRDFRYWVRPVRSLSPAPSSQSLALGPVTA